MAPQPLRLSEAQVREFRTEGMLVLRDLIEPAVLESWRAQFWAHHNESYGALEQDPETWLRVGQQEQDFFLPMQPEFGKLPQVLAVVAQLGAGEFETGARANENQSMTVVTMPKGPVPFTFTPHMDGFAAARNKSRGSGLGLMLAVTTYLYDVAPGGGSMWIWPRSHLPSHRYFSGPGREEIYDTQKVNLNLFEKIAVDPASGLEFTGKAGDCIFWHNLNVHSGSPNLNAVPRIALYARWHHSALEKARFGSDIWESWGHPAALPREPNAKL